MSNIITEEKMKQFNVELEKYKKIDGPLMPTLQSAQSIFGCVPIEVQKVISENLDLSIAKINGVVTFYGQFSTEPKGDTIISICIGTACYVRGAQALIDKACQDLGINPGKTTADKKYSLVGTRCIGACGLAPVITVKANGEEEVHGKLTVGAFDTVLKNLESGNM